MTQITKNVINFVKNNKFFMVAFVACATLWAIASWEVNASIWTNLQYVAGAAFGAAFFFGGAYMTAYAVKGIRKENGEAKDLHLDWLFASMMWFLLCGIFANSMDSLHNLLPTVPQIGGEWLLWVVFTPFVISFAIVTISVIASALYRKRTV